MDQLKPPTLEFLEELRERARHFGWRGDYIEIENFVETLYRDAGLPVPTATDMEPYPEHDGSGR